MMMPSCDGKTSHGYSDRSVEHERQFHLGNALGIRQNDVSLYETGRDRLCIILATVAQYGESVLDDRSYHWRKGSHVAELAMSRVVKLLLLLRRWCAFYTELVMLLPMINSITTLRDVGDTCH